MAFFCLWPKVVKHGMKFQGTLKDASMVCKWKKLSKEVQACGNGRADDPNAFVPDIVEHVEPQPAAPTELKLQKKKKTGGKRSSQLANKFK